MLCCNQPPSDGAPVVHVFQDQPIKTDTIHSQHSDENVEPSLPLRVDGESRRFLSIDAGRGFAVFLGMPIAYALYGLGIDWLPVRVIVTQLTHAVSGGGTLYDCGFPIILMAMGISIVISMTKRLEGTGRRRQLYRHIVVRSLSLMGLGLILTNTLLEWNWPEVRLAGILQRAAICYFVSAFAFLNLSTLGVFAFCVLILGSYWLMLMYIPVPGYGAGHFGAYGHLVEYVDRLWLPGKKNLGSWDLEGLLGTWPAISSCLLGVLFAKCLLGWKTDRGLKAFTIIGVGVISMAIGWGLNPWMPVNSVLWTPTFVLVAFGWGCVNFGGCFLIVDVWKQERWLFPAIVAGQNMLVAFAIMLLLQVDTAFGGVLGSLCRNLYGRVGTLIAVIVEIGILWSVVYWLYQKKIRLKL